MTPSYIACENLIGPYYFYFFRNQLDWALGNETWMDLETISQPYNQLQLSGPMKILKVYKHWNFRASITHKRVTQTIIPFLPPTDYPCFWSLSKNNHQTTKETCSSFPSSIFPKKRKNLSLSLSPLPISDATRRLRLCSILPTILSLSKPEPESEPEPELLRSSPESLRLRAAVHLHIHLLLLLLRRLLRLSLHIPSLFSKSRSYPCPNSYSHSSFI